MNPLLKKLEANDVRSSKIGKELANLALLNPDFLKQIIKYIHHDKKNVRSAVAECFAETSKVKPQIIVPYAGELQRALEYPEPQTRWEAIMALAEIAKTAPDRITNIDIIIQQLNEPKSMIVRAVVAIFLGNWGVGDLERRTMAYDLLREALLKYGQGNEVKEIIKALVKLAIDSNDSKIKNEVVSLIVDYKDHKTNSVIKTIVKSIKMLQK